MTFGIFAMTGPSGKPSSACRDDPVRLAHLLDPDQVPVVGVAVRSHGISKSNSSYEEYGKALRISHLTFEPRSTGR